MASQGSPQLESWLSVLAPERWFQLFQTLLGGLTLSSPPVTIQSFPNELLEQVFHHYIHDRKTAQTCFEDYRKSSSIKPIAYCRAGAGYDGDGASGAMSSPLIIASVCSHWRSIAHSTPTLWSTIFFRDPLPQDVELFELWLQRSKNTLLDITLQRAHRTNRHGPMRDIVTAALEQGHRIRLLSLNVHKSDIDFPWENMEIFQQLQSFDFQVEGWDQPTRFRFYHRMCKSKRLEAIPGPAINNIDPVLAPYVPWKQLKSITIKMPINLPSMVVVLDECQMLEHCSIWVLNTDNPSGISLTPRTLPLLRHFSIAGNKHGFKLLDYLCVPALETLHLRLGHTVLQPSISMDDELHEDTNLTTINKFGARSGCFVKSLSLTNDPNRLEFHPEELKAFWDLPMLCGLRHLAINSSTTTSSVETLTWKAKISQALPVLQTLQLGHHDDTNKGPISRMILSRANRKQSNLREVHVTFNGLTEPPFSWNN